MEAKQLWREECPASLNRDAQMARAFLRNDKYSRISRGNLLSLKLLTAPRIGIGGSGGLCHPLECLTLLSCPESCEYTPVPRVLQL